YTGVYPERGIRSFQVRRAASRIERRSQPPWHLMIIPPSSASLNEREALLSSCAEHFAEYQPLLPTLLAVGNADNMRSIGRSWLGWICADAAITSPRFLVSVVPCRTWQSTMPRISSVFLFHLDASH